MARLLSVNVGLPRDIAWNGRSVHTGIWKEPVRGRCRVGRLNLQGDGQGDLAGHGGEQRAVFVYQIESYHYWQARLHRSDFGYAQFGENFTIAGLADDVVCIGDRYRIGSALLEVTQPRTTCFRVGIRLNEPQMPALLTSSGRPGFYFRVLEEGEVGAGDEIVKVDEATERMTVAEINALLYSPPHPSVKLRQALRIEALSPGWRASFAALLEHSAASTGGSTATGGNAALMPEPASHPAAPGFRPLRVAAIERSASDVLSLSLQCVEDQPLPKALPGQYVVLRLAPTADGVPLFRSYSLSGPVSGERYRISVKLEPHGAAGTYLQQHVRAGDVLDVSAPRGSFTLQAGDRPVVLLSAGIGVTPVLAMLHELTRTRSSRPTLWLHGAHDRDHHAFGVEVQELLDALPHSRRHICYSRPGSQDKLGSDFDAEGHLSQQVLEHVGVPPEAEVYLCGPNPFMSEMKATLTSLGIAPERIHVELFAGSPALTPGIVHAVTRAPHAPSDDADTGPLVSFARSGIAVHWKPSAYQSILELAEACDVPVRWSCRTGVCHNCECGLVSGGVAYGPEPLDKPSEGNVLICCSRPDRDVVIDL